MTRQPHQLSAEQQIEQQLQALKLQQQAGQEPLPYEGQANTDAL
jgi:hypothetical protein